MKPKIEQLKNGEVRHFSVGALIERDGKYLLIDRVNVPLGFAGLAGHIDEGEDAKSSLRREVLEESGLKVEEYKLIAEENISLDKCVHGVKNHYWYLYRVIVSGDAILDTSEAKSIDWYTPDEIRKLTLEPVWEYWFTSLSIIS